MKDKPNQQKIVLKIVSVFVALVLWLFVTYTEDSLMDINVNSLEIHMSGEQNLFSKGLMVVNKQSIGKASVKIRGRRGDLISVMDSVSASVDLSKIESVGNYELTPMFDIPSSAVYVSKRNTLSVGVEIEKIIDKTVDIIVIQENTDKNKEYVVETVPKTEKIKVRGAKKDIEKIERATLYVDVSAITDDKEIIITPVFETINGEKLDIVNDIYYDAGEIGVRNKFYPKKTVDVRVNMPYSISGKYSCELISQSFDKADIGIINDYGNDVKTITAEFKNVFNLVTGKQKYTLDIEEYDGIYIPEKYRQIEVEVNTTESNITE